MDLLPNIRLKNRVIKIFLKNVLQKKLFIIFPNSVKKFIKKIIKKKHFEKILILYQNLKIFWKKNSSGNFLNQIYNRKKIIKIGR